MNCIAVLNLNFFLPQIARRHFQDAASRWGVEYVEITEPLCDRHHYWQKAFVPLSRHTERFQRVLQLDADMLVASDCPDPFGIIPESSFGVVSRVQPNRPTLRFPVEKWARFYSIKGYRKPHQHINAGLLLYNQDSHDDILRCWQSHAEQGQTKSLCQMPEQFVVSCLLSQGIVPVAWLEWKFNACRRTDRSVPRTSYIAHFHAPRHRPLSVIMSQFKFQRG